MPRGHNRSLTQRVELAVFGVQGLITTVKAPPLSKTPPGYTGFALGMVPIKSSQDNSPLGLFCNRGHDFETNLELPIVGSRSDRLVWRVGEGHQPVEAGEATKTHALRGGERVTEPRVFTKCGNQYPSSVRAGSAPDWAAPPPPHARILSAVNVSTYGWVYVF